MEDSILDRAELERRMADTTLSFDERVDAAEAFLAGVWASAFGMNDASDVH
jgi:hypothetical protein